MVVPSVPVVTIALVSTVLSGVVSGVRVSLGAWLSAL